MVEVGRCSSSCGRVAVVVVVQWLFIVVVRSIYQLDIRDLSVTVINRETR